MNPQFFEASGESDQEPASRRGRRALPIADEADIAHRGWLEPSRRHLNASGLTLTHLADRVRYSSPYLSQLLRGKGLYPRWELTARIGSALDMPLPPLQRLWISGAKANDKKDEWIDRCVHEAPLHRIGRPVALHALTEQMRQPYTDFASAFLLSRREAEHVVAEAFDILWMCWQLATDSPNANRYAWSVLRARVLPRAPQTPDGRIDLCRAALFTQAYADLGPDAGAAQLRESVELFDAISRLPHNPMDAVVLRYLCDQPAAAIPDILGVTPTLARVYHDHARQMLEADLAARTHPGGTAL